jgi:hypothetical protein
MMFVLGTAAVFFLATTLIFATLWRRERAYRVRLQGEHARMFSDLLARTGEQSAKVEAMALEMAPFAEWLRRETKV